MGLVSTRNLSRHRRRIESLNEISSAIVQADSKNAVAFVMRGVLHATNEEFDKAIEDFTKAISVRPDSHDAYINVELATLTIYWMTKASDFTQAIKVCPPVLRSLCWSWV
ncbi:MAG: hypothetical protein U0930_16095 [Pirellulales bacterium]